MEYLLLQLKSSKKKPYLPPINYVVKETYSAKTLAKTTNSNIFHFTTTSINSIPTDPHIIIV